MLVIHDEETWVVIEITKIDEEDYYELRGIGQRSGLQIVARTSECVPCEASNKPRIRKMRDSDAVLEFDGRTMTIRRKGSPKRYPISLLAIYHQAVKATVVAERIAKVKAKKAKRK